MLIKLRLRPQKDEKYESEHMKEKGVIQIFL